MNTWRNNLLAAYYYASLPLRGGVRLVHRLQSTMPVVVLFYHRVADEHPNDWTMSTAMFQRQVDWLQRHADIVSLEEAQRRLAAGSNRRLTVCLTFDDGYAENGAFALPLLIRRQIPCTYFVTLKNILYGEPFPHDVAAGRPLRPHRAEDIKTLAAAGIEIGVHTRTHLDLGQVTDRDQLYDEVVQAGTDLANLIDRPIHYFAFPYGLHANLSLDAAALARDAGLLGVCSAYGQYNFPGQDPFHLRRIHADVQWARFRNWLTLDPRKMRGESIDPLALSAAADSPRAMSAAEDDAAASVSAGRSGHE